jgi:hypothetical protein
MLEFLINSSGSLIVLTGIIFIVLGLGLRSINQSSHVFHDGMQGVSIATLLVLAFCIQYIDDQRSLKVIKENSVMVISSCLFTGLFFILEFKRSL